MTPVLASLAACACRVRALIALGCTKEGRPRIAWAAGRPGEPQALRSHAAPVVTLRGTPWEAEQAVACGPRLIHGGRIEIADRSERLASPGALPRTFVGY